MVFLDTLTRRVNARELLLKLDANSIHTAQVAAHAINEK